jgi:hypothetical protein
MMKRVFGIVALLISFPLFAQELITFSLKANRDYLDVPVSFPLQQVNYNMDSVQLELFEIVNSAEKPVACQVEAGHTAHLWFILEGFTQKNRTRRFVIKRRSGGLAKKRSASMSTKSSDGNLTLYTDDKPVLSYRFRTMYPPEGVNPLFERSGFIHPVWSPQGEMLSRVQPPDHYHHYGIWGPWTLTHIGERKVDFWNPADGEGTVRFAGFLSEVSGDVFAGFKALQQHIDFGGKGCDQIAINEILDVRVWNNSRGVWVIDYTTSLNTPLENGILFDAYRYGGGIGFRATERWNRENCTVLTSEGRSRADADGSSARWCIVEGESESREGRSGILFLSHPANRAHPEPMRVWPLDGNGGRGDLFFEFTPIRHKSWELKRGSDYTLKYRMIVFDGKIDPRTAEMYWNSFSEMPQIKVESIKYQ